LWGEDDWRPWWRSPPTYRHIDPNGQELSKQMPWRPLERMDDEELAAVYEYLTHLPGF
jgi:hypothetical protein